MKSIKRSCMYEAPTYTNSDDIAMGIVYVICKTKKDVSESNTSRTVMHTPEE